MFTLQAVYQRKIIPELENKWTLFRPWYNNLWDFFVFFGGRKVQCGFVSVRNSCKKREIVVFMLFGNASLILLFFGRLTMGQILWMDMEYPKSRIYLILLLILSSILDILNSACTVAGQSLKTTFFLASRVPARVCQLEAQVTGLEDRGRTAIFLHCSARKACQQHQIPGNWVLGILLSISHFGIAGSSDHW